jgi:hypothetical protein
MNVGKNRQWILNARPTDKLTTVACVGKMFPVRTR